MSHKKKNPVNLNLLSFKFPVPALVSIAHRISGVLLFLLTPVMIYALAYSLGSANQFTGFIVSVQTSIFLKLIVWVTMLALMYHLLAGVRHLIMDMGFGETFSAARISAIVLIIVFIALIVLTGLWIW